MKKICAFLTGIAVLAALATRAQSTVDLKAFLEGPYFSGALTPWLNGWGYLPLDHPYDASPWFYYGPEAVTAIPNADVVDWVLVELRQTTGAASTATQDSAIARQVGFILKNGSIVGVDGSSPLQFNVAVTSNLYAVVMTRNHLGIMSGYPLQLSGGIYSYDFTTAADKVYGGVNGHKLIATGVWAMVSGDGDSNGNVNNADKIDVWKPQSGNAGYLNGDFNMNGQVDNVDKNEYWKVNSGRSSQVPGGSANTPPVAVIQVNPPTGTTITVFTLDASASYDAQSKPALLAARWDFENDGTWDTPYSTTKAITHQYLTAGDYIIQVEVIDLGGLTDTETCNLQVGQSYGTPCPGIPTVTYEGQVYNTVQIGTQCWLKENLNVGTMINGSQNQANNQVIEKYCYNNDPGKCSVYGGLYQWDELMQYTNQAGARGICPPGWHVPKQEEWNALIEFLGGIGVAGGKMKDVGTLHWNPPNVGATNESGFTALPGGSRPGSSYFTDLGNTANFWSSTEAYTTYAWLLTLVTYDAGVLTSYNPKANAVSARCLMEPPPPVWSCGDTIVDARDGQVYNTVEIGSQCWMQENLNVGTMIQGTSNQTNNSIIEKYCYSNNTTNCDVYGGLYQWDEMMQYVTSPGVKGICPDGWHLPTDAEYCTVSQFIDLTVNCSILGWSGTDVGTKMKSTTGWYGGQNGTNASGFTALPGGLSSSVGTFYDLTYNAYFRSSSESGTLAWGRTLTHYSAAIYRDHEDKDAGFSVRCVKNASPPIWSCGDTIVDARDGQVYNTVEIGTQCWMQENLNIGTMIQGSASQTNNGIIEKYCYDNSTSNCDVYGGLYQWDEMMQYSTTPGLKGICPAGWHLPTDGEYCTLTQFIDPTVDCNIVGLSGSDAGIKMKSTTGWYVGGNGSNSSGFTGLPGGYFAPGDHFYDLTSQGIFSSSSEFSNSYAWHRSLSYSSSLVYRGNIIKELGSSVRCIKFPTPPSWTCGDTIVDTRDGQVYNTVQIGTQCWMQENLNIGTMILGTGNQINNGTIEKYCYDNSTANCDVYGGLYQWDEMMLYTTTSGVKGICPDGWHLPTDAEYCNLTQFIDPTVNCSSWDWTGTDIGYKMKSSIGWSGGGNGSNEFDFTALPAGYRSTGVFLQMYDMGSFWTSSFLSGQIGVRWYLEYYTNKIARDAVEIHGYSVRCVKDAPNQAPFAPSNPDPQNNSTNLPISTQLSWNCADPENDPLTFDVYFGTASTPPQAVTGQNESTYNPGALQYSTTYYWKIVAHDDHGNTTEGPVWSFTTLSQPFWQCGNPFVDPRDNQIYSTVPAGGHCWMAKNLNIGVMIQGNDQTNNGVIEKYCYGDNSAICDEYGGLYQWNEMMQYTQGGQGICPPEWYLPTFSAWEQLENSCGGGYVAGGPMKEVGYEHWQPPNTGATNSSGFTAIAGGFRDRYSFFSNKHSHGLYWTTEPQSSNLALYIILFYDSSSVGHEEYHRNSALSVRCVR